MRIETNVKLVKRNRQVAQSIFVVSLVLLGIGCVGTNSRFLAEALSQSITIDSSLLAIAELVLPAIILPVAFATTLFSVRMTNLWVREPRPDAIIPENLKGLSKETVLYNYYHFPARHVLVCPQGVFAIVTRFQDGNFMVNGDRWQTRRNILSRLLSMFRLDGVGNPSLDAIFAAEQVKKSLEKAALNVEVQPLVLFVDPRVKLTVESPSVPVLHAQSKLQPSLKDYLKALPKKTMLTTDQLRAFEAATGVQSDLA